MTRTYKIDGISRKMKQPLNKRGRQSIVVAEAVLRQWSCWLSSATMLHVQEEKLAGSSFLCLCCQLPHKHGLTCLRTICMLKNFQFTLLQ
ncbi:hypothetical protein ACET3Z_028899 [Daucus carota]